MHESSLAKQMVQMVLERAAENGARVVRQVRGWVAETERLSPESLRLHFLRHAQGTPAQEAALHLRLEHVGVKCDGCGGEYPPEHHLLICPRCGHVGGTPVGRTGIGIEALDVE